MLPTTNQLPTLGYLHKVVCDCLGLWNSDNEDITFHVSATEKEIRTQLRQAFESIKSDDGTYGSLGDLAEATSKFASKEEARSKKSRTIQTYVNHIAKTDFESVHEYSELREYVEVLLTTRYACWGVSELAVSFYRAALDHYREFIREHPCNSQSQTYSYQFFLGQPLRLITNSLPRELLPDNDWPDVELDEPWPLKGFADTASRITDISLHKLHQYHYVKQEGRLKEPEVWALDLTSQPVSTRSKQVIERLRKPNRMRWETFYRTLHPLTHQLPRSICEKTFATHAFAAMIAHNLNIQVADYGSLEPLPRGCQSQSQVKPSHSKASSDLLDLLFNDYPIANEVLARQASIRYQTMLATIRTLPGSLQLAIDIPNSQALVYKKEFKRFSEGSWYATLRNPPSWINEWMLAREAVFVGDASLALSHFKTALYQAKYAAGPLFIPFFIQVCAFCKSQYRLLSERKEAELFERFYEELGSNAAQYAALVGYTSGYKRDPQTLFPYTTLPLKMLLINKEIDALARALHT